MAIENLPSCHIWLSAWSSNSKYSFEGEAECVDGRLSGPGTLDEKTNFTGLVTSAEETFEAGRREGPFVLDLLGLRSAGTYVAGEQHGAWTTTYRNDLFEQVVVYERGKPHGPATQTYTGPDRGGSRTEGTYEDGKRAGRWATEFGDGGWNEFA